MFLSLYDRTKHESPVIYSTNNYLEHHNMLDTYTTYEKFHLVMYSPFKDSNLLYIMTILGRYC